MSTITREEENMVELVIFEIQRYKKAYHVGNFVSKDFLQQLKSLMEADKSIPKGIFNISMLRDPFSYECTLMVKYDNDKIQNHKFKFRLEKILE